MRIIGGKFKGRRIIAARGDISRPTTDRTRESLFNILANLDWFDFERARVIDLFAGSGALGFEAMSRGAAWCLFVETDASARGAIRENVEALELFGATRIHRRSAASLGQKPASAGTPFTLAFLDPPYRKDLAGPALETLKRGEWLADGALIAVEHGKDETLPVVAGYVEFDRRIYGQTQLTIYRFEQAPGIEN